MLAAALVSAALLPVTLAFAPDTLPPQRIAPPPPDLKEWTVPWPGTRPRDPFVDRKGRVWFVGQEGNYVAYLDRATGKFERYAIPDGTHPHNLVVAPDGKVWFTGNRNGRLLRLDPVSRAVSEYPMPDPAVADPHTMILDRGGNAWFTAQNAGVVGRRDTRSGVIRLWKTGEGTRPYGIELDRGGRVWFDLFGTNAIGLIDPATMQLRRFPLPDPSSRPRRIAVTADGVVWYGDYARGYLGRLDPKSGSTSEFKLPAGPASLPYAMAADDQGRIWVAETGVTPNRLVAFDPTQRAFTERIETGGGSEPNTIRHMTFHVPTREIWFGTDRNTVGRVRLAPANRPQADRRSRAPASQNRSALRRTSSSTGPGSTS
ncbi:MAG: lyase [Gemmatimonadales bacterium]|nr:lyase [Gemmatimonadales bacterium]